MHLKNEEFLEVIKNTPLVSIDIVFRDENNRILLGWRKNEPAKGMWFVPGGRIKKNERIESAFKRITRAETGNEYTVHEARLIGTFTHLYNTNVFLAENISTHYVVLAYEIYINEQVDLLDQQHNNQKWFSCDEAINCKDIHENTKVYFETPSSMDSDQYQILNSRRDSFNNLVWQTPVLSLTAQAFLFTIILSGGTPKFGRFIAAFLASIVALMSLQLIAKHRFMEEQHAKILHIYENFNKHYAANRQFHASNWAVKISSYWVWRVILWAFFIMAIISTQLILLGVLNN